MAYGCAGASQVLSEKARRDADPEQTKFYNNWPCRVTMLWVHTVRFSRNMQVEVQAELRRHLDAQGSDARYCQVDLLRPEVRDAYATGPDLLLRLRRAVQQSVGRAEGLG